MFHLRIEQDKLISLWIEGEILEFSRPAIKSHELSFLSEYACKLVHNAAHYATIVVLGGLSCKHHVPFRHLIVAKEVVQSESKAAFECGR